MKGTPRVVGRGVPLCEGVHLGSVQAGPEFSSGSDSLTVKSVAELFVFSHFHAVSVDTEFPERRIKRRFHNLFLGEAPHDAFPVLNPGHFILKVFLSVRLARRLVGECDVSDFAGYGLFSRAKELVGHHVCFLPANFQCLIL